MNHRKKVKSFGRVAKERKAMLRGLVASLVRSGGIKTTLAKAKALRPYVEKTVSQAQKKDMATVRNLRREFGRETVELLVNQWGPLFSKRKGGYTRISKLMLRQSDASPMALIEFVEKPVKSKAKAEKKEKIKNQKPKKAKIKKN